MMPVIAITKTSPEWPLESKQLLIDSILNNFDIGTIYFESVNDTNRHLVTEHPANIEHLGYQYFILDGQQRLEAITGFYNNKFPMSNNSFIAYEPSLDIRNLTYSEIKQKYPGLARVFTDYVLSITSMTANSVTLMDEMLLRLSLNKNAQLAELHWEARVNEAKTTTSLLRLQLLAQDEDYRVRKETAQSLAANRELLSKLADDEHYLVRQSVVKATYDAELLTKLATDSSIQVRSAVAVQTSDPLLLQVLSQDESWEVRFIVAGKSFDEKTLAKLSLDHNFVVAAKAQEMYHRIDQSGVWVTKH